jgi:hypothetical protein
VRGGEYSTLGGSRTLVAKICGSRGMWSGELRVEQEAFVIFTCVRSVVGLRLMASFMSGEFSFQRSKCDEYCLVIV